MKLETFFNKFDQFADAPDAVAKMRALVLNLAVQGRLVSNCSENPLSAEQIASEKQRRLRELNIRSHPETPQPTENDFPFSLPESWHAVALGDLAFSCPTSYGEDPIPSLPKAGVVKVGNIDNQGGFKGHFSERGFLPNEIESLLARRGDLMVVKSSGSAENVHSGKTALCTAEHDGKIVGTNFVLRLRLLGTPALPEYVWRVLTSRYSRAWIEGTVQTMTYPNLKWSDFARLPIPLPPLAEQKRIVAKVDELMALCDRLESQQQERETRHAALARASLARFADAPTPANLPFLFHPSYAIPPADLRKSILTLAVQGYLSGTPPTVVEEQTVLLDSATDPEFPISYGVLKPGPQFPNGIRLVKSQHIRDWKVSEDIEYLISPELDAEFKRTKIKGGEVLLNLVGASIGRCAIAPASLKGANVSRAVAVITLRPEVDAMFFLILLTSAFTPERVDALSSGTAQPVLNLGVIRKMQVWLPPLAEQRRIVAKVEQLMALVDALETQLAASRATAANLLSALVAELTTASANGAAPSQPGATPQVKGRKHNEG